MNEIDSGQRGGGELLAIWIKRFHRGPMDRVEVASMVAGGGLEGSADQGRKRQVTILSAEQWQEICQQLGAEIDPKSRRANLLVRGLDLRRSRRRILLVGSCRIRVYGETRPCHLMDEAHDGLQEALRSDWRGGIFGEVLDDGEIRVGDGVRWLESE